MAKIIVEQASEDLVSPHSIEDLTTFSLCFLLWFRTFVWAASLRLSCIRWFETMLETFASFYETLIVLEK